MQQSKVRTLNTEEQAKVDCHGSVQLELRLLQANVQAPPAAGTLAQRSGSLCSAALSMPAAAGVAAAVAASQSALMELTPPPTRIGTRKTAIEVLTLNSHVPGTRIHEPRLEHCCAREITAANCLPFDSAQVMKRMASDRAAFESARQALRERVQVAEQTLLALLRHPLESWGDAAVWQLCMCEFADSKIDDSMSVDFSSAKQLQLLFRAACEEARHPAEVPRAR